MSLRRLPPVFVCALLAAGCAHPDGDGVPLPMETFEILDGIAGQVIADGCRDPRIEEEPVPNRHLPDATDTLRTLRCEGIEARLHIGAPEAGGKELPVYLEATRPTPQVPDDLDVGASVDAVAQRLGPPTVREDARLRYETQEVPNAVTFTIGNGRVRALRWDWYVD